MYQVLIVSLFCLMVLSACNINDEASNESSVIDESPQRSISQSTSLQQPGRIAYIDPTTGELTSKPNDYQLKRLEAENQGARLQQQSKQLVVEERMPSGSYKASVPQSLYSQLTATVDADGNLKVRHQASPLSTKKETTSQ